MSDDEIKACLDIIFYLKLLSKKKKKKLHNVFEKIFIK